MLRRGWGSSSRGASVSRIKGGALVAGRVLLTLRLPPVRTTFTKRRVYVSLFLARPLLFYMSVSRILSRY
jgi:hypothetical protein